MFRYSVSRWVPVGGRIAACGRFVNYTKKGSAAAATRLGGGPACHPVCEQRHRSTAARDAHRVAAANYSARIIAVMLALAAVSALGVHV